MSIDLTMVTIRIRDRLGHERNLTDGEMQELADTFVAELDDARGGILEMSVPALNTKIRKGLAACRKK